jgi:muramoyltetrapeptide carboxypeptidase
MAQPLKPPALRPGDAIRVLSLASPVQEDRLEKGCRELARLGYSLKFDRDRVLARDGFFAGSASDRAAALLESLADPAIRAVFCTRGGYGSTYLLENLRLSGAAPKILIGYSDLSSLQIFLWQTLRWVTFYGPMVASGLDRGADAAEGYSLDSFIRALTETKSGWTVNLLGESLAPGTAEGTLLGGCLTLVETTLGTPWELATPGAILLLEDLALKPYQLDRSLMHLKQAGKFRGVAGIILGEFPQFTSSAEDKAMREVARRILQPLGVPVVWGAPIGHTRRPMLTLPLGASARLVAPAASDAPPTLDILEPACAP